MEYLGAAFAKLQEAAASYQHWHRNRLVSYAEVSADSSCGESATAVGADASAGATAADRSQRRHESADTLYVSSIALNIGLSFALVGTAKIAHNYLLSRATRQRNRVILLKKIRNAVARWEEPCFAEIAECLSVPRAEAEWATVRRQVCGLLGGSGKEKEADALLALWAAFTEDASKSAVAAVRKREREAVSAVQRSEGDDSSGANHSSSSSDRSGEMDGEVASAPVTAGRAYNGIVASVAYASDFPLLSLGHLCYVAKDVLTLEEDLRTLQRLECILRYVFFRRAAMIEEVALHAHLWRRAVLMYRRPRGPHEKCRSMAGASPQAPAAVPPLRKGCTLYHAWRVYGRPSWLVPFFPEKGESGPLAQQTRSTSETATCIRHYLSLPHSYFPLEALQYMPVRWYETLACTTLDQFDKHCPKELANLAKRAAAAENDLERTGDGDRGSRTLAATQSATHCWYLLYASPLLKQNAAAHSRLMRERFCEQLFHGMRRSTGRGADELLFDCDASRLTRARPDSQFAVHGIFQSLATQLRLRKYLAIRGLLSMTRSLLELTGCNQEWNAVAFITVEVVRHTAMKASSSPSATVAETVSTPTPLQGSQTDTLLGVVLRSFAYSTFALLAHRAVDRIKIELSSPIREILTDCYEEDFRTALTNMDDAFFQRAIDGEHRHKESYGDGGKGQYSVTNRTEASEADYLMSDTISDLARVRCESAIGYFDDTVCSWMSFTVQSLCVLYRREVLPLAALVFSRRAAVLSEWVPLLLGIATQQKVSSELRRLEHESLPTDAPHGLTVLIDLLAEDEVTVQGAESAATNSVAGASLAHPFLALVACAGVWEHPWLRNEGVDGTDAGTGELSTPPLPPAWQKVTPWPARRPFAVQRLYTVVSAFPYIETLAAMERLHRQKLQRQRDQEVRRTSSPPSLFQLREGDWRLSCSLTAPLSLSSSSSSSFLSRLKARRLLSTGSGSRGRAVVEALQEDVACIAYYEVDVQCSRCEEALRQRREEDVAAAAMARVGHDKECGDEENRLDGTLRVTPTTTVAAASATSTHFHPAMDPEEIAMVQSPGYSRYLPTQLQGCELFDTNRFILKQLGLELVFAHRAITNLEQNHMADKSLNLGNIFDSEYYNPLKEMLDSALELLYALAFIAATSSVVTREGWFMSPRPAWEVLLVNARVPLYKDVLKKLGIQSYNRIFFPRDLAVFAPTTIGDDAAYAQSEALVERREAWRDYMKAAAAAAESLPPPSVPPPSESTIVLDGEQTASSTAAAAAAAPANLSRLSFDRSGRITGGFLMRRGIELHNVHFAYPQLQHQHRRAVPEEEKNEVRENAADSEGGAGVDSESVDAAFRSACIVKPTLTNACARFPADALTAVVGRTGSGKSSLAKLLKRLYDPLPVVAVEWPVTEMAVERTTKQAKDTPGHDTHSNSGAAVVEAWSEDLLCRVLWLQWVENALPPPPKLSTHVRSDGSSANLGRDREPETTRPMAILASPGHLTWDGLPLSCFSTNYLRRWLAHLDQHPAILQTMTFEENIRYVAYGVTPRDITSAVDLCQCSEFIRRAPMGLRNVTGTLSGGERQRLALARVLAGVWARVRLESCEESYEERYPPPPPLLSTGDGDNDAAAAEAIVATEGGLLLDEPTSHLDAHSEMQVQASIASLLPRSHTRSPASAFTPGSRHGDNGAWPPEASKARDRTNTTLHASHHNDHHHQLPHNDEDDDNSDDGEHDGNALPSLMLIVIAHRMATLQSAAHMIVVEGGRVSCQGPPALLRERNAFVRRQYELQDLHNMGGETCATALSPNL